LFFALTKNLSFWGYRWLNIHSHGAGGYFNLDGVLYEKESEKEDREKENSEKEESEKETCGATQSRETVEAENEHEPHGPFDGFPESYPSLRRPFQCNESPSQEGLFFYVVMVSLGGVTP
jgi:hypothetical protein